MTTFRAIITDPYLQCAAVLLLGCILAFRPSLWTGLLALFVAAVLALVWIVWTGLLVNYRPKL